MVVSRKSGKSKYFIFALALGLAATSAQGAVQSILGSGKGVAWRSSAHVNFVGNPTNSSGISPADFFQAVTRSLTRWSTGSQGKVGFDYWQGTESGVYEANSNLNGQSSIYFASKSGEHLGKSVLGITQVWFNDHNGDVYETDTVLNDLDYVLTTEPTDSSQNGTGRVFIENIRTHEFGHAYGLSHEQSPLSTMLYVESKGQAHLGCDDMAAVRGIYSDVASQGRLRGMVKFGPDTSKPGMSAFGARVIAVSREHGRFASSGIVQADGSFQIGGLEAGSYSILIEPFYMAAQVLPSAYSQATSWVCPAGNAFARSALASRSDLDSIEVSSGQTTWISDLEPNCSATGAANLPVADGTNALATAPQVVIAADQTLAFIDQVAALGAPHYYQLGTRSGDLKLSGMAQALYSPISVQLRLLDASGNLVQSGVAVERGGSEITATALPAGEYFIEVTAQAADLSPYSSAIQSLFDQQLFFVVTGSLETETSSQFPMGASCSQNESSFTSYQSPPGNPPRSTGGLVNGTASGPACGRIEAPADESPSDSLMRALIGIAPWALSLGGLWFRRMYATL